MEDALVNLEENERIVLGKIIRVVGSIRYGCFHITVHDTAVVPIDKTEKIRFDGKGVEGTKGMTGTKEFPADES